MEHIADLPAKLDLLLKAMSLSRVGLAQKLGVDKSLVGRWLAGKVHPSEHNLARFAEIAAESLPGFRLADLHGASDALARKFGIDPPQRSREFDLAPGSPLAAFLEAAGPEIAFRSGAYEGYWRTSRPSLLMSDRVFHDYAMLRRGAGGLIEVTTLGSGLDFGGWAFPVAGNLFMFLYDLTGRTPLSLLFKGVSLPKAMVLDGLLTMAALDSNRTPVALPIVAERVGDLVGDVEDDRRCFEQILEEAREPEFPLSAADLERRLYRDIGPAAAALGGSQFLAVDGLGGLSRGAAGPSLRG